MVYHPDTNFLSIGIIFALVTLLYFILLRVIHHYRNTQAVFSRSMLLIRISLTCSYTLTLSSITYGTLILNNFHEISPEMIAFYISLSLLNQFFFTTILLKVYRITTLLKLNNGLFNTENSDELRRRLSNSWNFKIILAYGFISILPRVAAIIIDEIYESSQSRIASIVIIGFQVFCESGILLMLVAYIIRNNCETSLRIEYLLYSLTWGGAFVLIGRKDAVIFMLVLPIRNILMEMVNAISIYEHDKHFFLPLPDVIDFIDLDFILRSEFFVKKFREYFLRVKNRKVELEFEILLGIYVYRESKVEDVRGDVESKIKIYMNRMKGFGSLGLVGIDFCQVYSEVYVEFDNNFLQMFLKSNEFHEMKIDYNSG